MMPTENPFAVTRAVDFTDQEIFRKWVELPGEGGVTQVAKPGSAMPMIVLGGKGSGKTHLLRFLSTGARLAGGASREDILQSGYLGIYLRCSGINASRFSGKGRSDEEWAAVYCFYMDLTLAKLAVEDALRVLPDKVLDPGQEKSACEAIRDIFDEWQGPPAETLRGLAQFLAERRREIDIEVNNCALTKRLNVRIQATPGRLVLGIPAALAGNLDPLRGVRFVYLIDEMENLDESQQVYVNSLVRENAPPCSLKIGARVYGLRTLRTLSSEEELKEGSEYERLGLDDFFRATGDRAFRDFAAQLCAQRLRDAGFAIPSGGRITEWVTSQFASLSGGVFGDEDIGFVEPDSRDRRWMQRLKTHLAEVLHVKSGAAKPFAERVIDDLSIPAHPLVERVALHVFYQKWHQTGLTQESAAQVGAAARDFVSAPSNKSQSFRQSFNHFKSDMLAQIYRDYKRPLTYAGFAQIVQLAYGLPRVLLVILKQVFGWSVFREERPFSSGKVSTESQTLGISDAAEWFYSDARMAGLDGDSLQRLVDRLGELFRAVRYSDKPSEVGLCTVSFDWASASIESRRLLQLAEKWSLLGRVDGGRPDRNSFRVDAKFRLNPLLAVRFGVSTVVRGDISLAGTEVDVLVQGTPQEVAGVVEGRTSAMRAPTFGRKGRLLVGGKGQLRTLPLPGIGDD